MIISNPNIRELIVVERTLHGTLDFDENQHGILDVLLNVKVHFITKEGGNAREILKAFRAKSQAVSDANLGFARPSPDSLRRAPPE